MGKHTKSGEAYYDEDGKQICGAQRRGQPVGTRCKRRPVKGMLRCKDHGGQQRRGVANPNFRHGRYADLEMPDKMATRYKAAMDDPEYLSLRPELAIVDSMLADRIETLTEGGSGDYWKTIRKQMGVFKSAMASGDIAGMRSAVSELDEVINAGASEAAARAETLSLIRDRQRLSESIQRSMVQFRQIVTIEQAISLMARIIGIVESGVSDPKERAVVLQNIAELAAISAGESGEVAA